MKFEGAKLGPTATSAGALDVVDLSRRLSAQFALKSVTFQCPIGGLTGIIGPNGSGKTTLFNLICGLLTPDSGQIWLRGRLINRLRLHQLARMGVGRTFQHIRLPALLTVGQVMGLASASASRDGSRRWGSDFAKEGSRPPPEQYSDLLEGFELEGLIDVPVGELSFGQSKLTAISAALVRQPSVLLLDEPFAGLHRDQAARLSVVIRTWRERTGSTALIVDHNISVLMALCGSFIVLDEGQVVASGTPESVMSSASIREVFFA